MDTKKILQSTLFLIFVLAGTNFNAQNENVCMNFGIIYKNISSYKSFIWPADYPSLRQRVQNVDILLLNPFYNVIYRKAFLEKLELLKISFATNRLFYCSKADVETFAFQEDGGVLFKFASYLKKFHLLHSNKLAPAKSLNRNNCTSSLRKQNLKFSGIGTTVIKTETELYGLPGSYFFTTERNLREQNKTISQTHIFSNRISSTFSQHQQKSTFVNYTSNETLSMICDNQTEFDIDLDDNNSEEFGGIYLTHDYAASPSLDLPTLQNSLRTRIPSSPTDLKGGGSFIIHHAPISNAFELLGSIRSQPSFSTYNEESSTMMSTPVMSDSVVYSYSSTESTGSHEIDENYTLVTTSGMFSSSFSEASFSGRRSSTAIFASSAPNDSTSSDGSSFLNVPDEY